MSASGVCASMRRLALLAALAALLGAAPAALAESAPVDRLPNTRVGTVDGTRAFVALSIEHGRVRAYVCDGTATRRPTISQWFTGRWDGHRALTLKAGGRTLRVDAGGGRGELIKDGSSNTFKLTRAKAPAGLFERTHAPLEGAWISLGTSRIRGAMVDPRPRKCRAVLVSTSSGSTWVMVCG